MTFVRIPKHQHQYGPWVRYGEPWPQHLGQRECPCGAIKITKEPKDQGKVDHSSDSSKGGK